MDMTPRRATIEQSLVEIIRKKDPVGLDILKEIFYSVCREMGAVMLRTSYSDIFNEGCDYSTALFDADGNMVAQGENVTCHIAAMEQAVKATINYFGMEKLRQGDLIVLNDPYMGGTHLPDITVVKPVMWKDEVVLFPAVRGHHMDVGGARPGSYAGDYTSIFMEGIRIPPVKLYSEGKLNEDLWNFYLANVRIPKITSGDLRAQIAACNLGEKRLVELLEKHGRDMILAAKEDNIAYTEKRMRAEIETFPDGTYEYEDYMEKDFAGGPYMVKLALTIRGSDIVADWRGSSPQANSPLNASYAVTCAGTYIAVMAVADPTIPRNHGCFAPVQLITKPGTVVHATHPAPVVGGNTEMMNRVINCMWGALAQAVPERIITGAVGSTNNLCFGGFDPRLGAPYVEYYFPPGGWGARAAKDGLSLCISILGGDTSNTPEEIKESRTPWITWQVAVVPDSGGPGKWRGGNSMSWKRISLDHVGEFGCNCERTIFPEAGVFGGMPGKHATNKVYRGAAKYIKEFIHLEEDELDKRYKYDGSFNRCGNIHITPEDVFFHRSPGGGGYGDPCDRDASMVLDDVLNGYVSVEAAARDYGVVIGPNTAKVDQQATDRLRKQLKKERKRDTLFIDQATMPFARTPLRTLKVSGLPEEVRHRLINRLKENGYTVSEE